MKDEDCSETHKGPAMSMWGVYMNAKGTKKQKHKEVYRKHKAFFDSLPKGRQTRLF